MLKLIHPQSIPTTIEATVANNKSNMHHTFKRHHSQPTASSSLPSPEHGTIILSTPKSPTATTSPSKMKNRRHSSKSSSSPSSNLSDDKDPPDHIEERALQQSRQRQRSTSVMSTSSAASAASRRSHQNNGGPYLAQLVGQQPLHQNQVPHQQLQNQQRHYQQHLQQKPPQISYHQKQLQAMNRKQRATSTQSATTASNNNKVSPHDHGSLSQSCHSNLVPEEFDCYSKSMSDINSKQQQKQRASSTASSRSSRSRGGSNSQPRARQQSPHPMDVLKHQAELAAKEARSTKAKSTTSTVNPSSYKFPPADSSTSSLPTYTISDNLLQSCMLQNNPLIVNNNGSDAWNQDQAASSNSASILNNEASAELHTLITSMQVEFSRLRSSKIAAETNLSQLQTKYTLECEEMERQYEEKSREVDVLKDMLTEMEATSGSNNQANSYGNSEVQKLQQQLQQTQKQNTILQNQNTLLYKENESLQKKCKKLTKTKDVAEAKVITSQQICSTYEQRVDELERECEKLKKQNEVLKYNKNVAESKVAAAELSLKDIAHGKVSAGAIAAAGAEDDGNVTAASANNGDEVAQLKEMNANQRMKMLEEKNANLEGRINNLMYLMEKGGSGMKKTKKTKGASSDNSVVSGGGGSAKSPASVKSVKSVKPPAKTPSSRSGSTRRLSGLSIMTSSSLLKKDKKVVKATF